MVAPAFLVGTSSLMQFAGSKKSARAAKARGRAKKRLTDFEAAQLEQQAGQSIAVSQRGAAEERRRADLTASRALALAAAGGGGVSDPTMQNLFADIEGEGAYRSAVALYEGEEQARQLKLAAQAKRMEGDIALQGGEAEASAYNLAGIGSLLEGAGSLYMKYGGKGPVSGQERYGSDYDAYNSAGY